MKHLTRTLIFIFVLATLLLSACAGAAAPASNSAADKVQADLVEFTGVIEAINGTQWTINGQVVTIDPSVIRDGPFQVGDTVKLEAQVAQDGSVVVTRVETPSVSAADNGNTNSADDGNSNSISNANSNSNSNSNSNDNSSAPDPTTGSLVFDDGGNEAFGSVDSMTADAIVIGGQAFALTNGSEFKNLIATGDFVKVHFVLNADGTYTIVEIETWDPAAVSNGNSNSNSNDDNSNGNSNGNSNSNDDDDDNSNGNSNDDDDDDNGNDNGDDDDDDDDDDNGNDDNSNGNG